MINYKTKLSSLKNLIGNTPLAKINLIYKGNPISVYAKLEYFNFSGSIKDRMAFNILTSAYENGKLHAGDTIIEATSGNTGISFSAQGSYLGHKVKIFMPSWMSNERKSLISSYGAEIVLVDKVLPDGQAGGFIGSVRLAKEYAKTHENCFLPLQFDNPDNTMAHCKGTAAELISQMKKFNVVPDAFTAGVGTGGTIMGVRNYLKEINSNISCYPMEPLSSPTLSTGYKVGSHRIQGISDEFIPSLLKLDQLDEIIAVDDGDAIIMAQMLSRQLGLGVGISSGANLIASIIAQEKYGKKIVATVFSDDNKKYLSTDYMKNEPIKPDFYSQHIKLISFDTTR